MNGKALIKLLVANGWKISRVKGSHYVLKKDNLIEVIPVHGSDLPTGLLNSILKRNGLK